jgi:hypothetical protein
VRSFYFSQKYGCGTVSNDWTSVVPGIGSMEAGQWKPLQVVTV